jgi:hypothetical protein
MSGGQDDSVKKVKMVRFGSGAGTSKIFTGEATGTGPVPPGPDRPFLDPPKNPIVGWSHLLDLSKNPGLGWSHLLDPPKTPVWGGLIFSLICGHQVDRDRGPGPYPVASPVKFLILYLLFDFVFCGTHMSPKSKSKR